MTVKENRDIKRKLNVINYAKKRTLFANTENNWCLIINKLCDLGNK